MLQWLAWNAVLSALIACVICDYKLVPITVGLKVDLLACRVQYYARCMDLYYPLDTTDFYYRDRVARLYLKYVGPWPADYQWVTDHETTYWMDDEYKVESPDYYGFIWDQNGLANLLTGHMTTSNNKSHIPPMDEAATAHVIQRFLQLARETGSRDAARGYTYSLWDYLRTDPHSMTLTELLRLERKLDHDR